MTVAAAPVAASRAASRVRGFRRDIQALRAVAIGLVVLNHLWPERIPGGFVGVDVFFVISGFLITGHLLSEVDRTGGVRLSAFYARRIRRLLPAALLVVVVTLVGVCLLLPFTRWTDNALQSLASVFYVENWALASLSVNYSAHNAAASAVQHYWSLSVEEQFYLVWPLLVLGAVVVASRRAGSRRHMVVSCMVGVVAVASLLAAIAYTAASPAQAYFVTFTRAWEFAVGALVALLPATVFRRLNAVAASVLALLGFGGIAVAAFAFGPQTPYPGTAALVPVLATAAVIAAGTGRRAPLLLVSSATDARPVQWLGDISYSLYLWHWPLIVLTPFAIGAPLSVWSKVAILGLAVVLATATRRWVEVPAQRAAWWRPTRRAYLGGGALMGVATLVALLLLAAGSTRVAAVADDDSAVTCQEGGGVGAPGGCDPSVPVADPLVTEADAYFRLAPQCGDLLPLLEIDDRATTRVCDFSEDGAGPRVWLVGDSHAEQWQAALFPIAEAEGWRLTISSFPGCSPADVAFVGFVSAWGPVDYERCRTWAAALDDQLVGEDPDLVVTSMAARQQLVDDGTGRPHDEQFVEGLRRTWQRWTDEGIAVVAISDTPLNASVRDPDCLVLNPGTPMECAAPRSAALPSDPVSLAATDPLRGLRLADMSRFLCDAAECFAAIGGEPVYYDADHLSSAYTETLSDVLRPVIDEAIGDAASSAP